jgi:hypothetical protein
MSNSTTTTAATLVATVKDEFESWKQNCSAPSIASLRAQARTYFVSLGFHQNQAIAVLIQQVLDGSLETTRALALLTGALEGLSSLPFKLTKLLGNFLLTHCAPIESDSEEEIRDAAMQAFAVLLMKTNLKNSTTTAEDDSTITEKEEAVLLCLQLTTTAVENRVAVSEDKSLVGYESTFSKTTSVVRNGLSLLSRSRRALCFDVVRAGVDAVSQIKTPISKQLAMAVLDALVAMAVLAASCLMGESDPRCLMQLLDLLHVMLHGFQPYFVAAESAAFPLADLFDAIAPYYPIQFTPPPNDTHGLTKEGLRRVLLSVMCYTGYDDMARKADKDTMLLLSLSLVLDQIVPLEEDEPTSVAEKLEALDDLSVLLFPRDTMANDTVVAHLNAATLANLSDALLHAHEVTCIAVASGSSEAKQAKEAADLCRTLVSKIALECERATKNKTLWASFVGDPLQKLSTRLVASPAQGRVAIAYVACLCSCGGVKTLQCCLEMGLVPLVDIVSSDMLGQGDLMTSIYGIGAFFSAAQTAISKLEKVGVVFYPHPLEAYTLRATEQLLAFIGIDNDAREYSTGVATAVVRAMESVLMAAQADSLRDRDDVLALFLATISEPLLLSEQGSNYSEDDASHEWSLACTQTLGRIIGATLEKKSASGDFLATESCAKVVQQDILPRLVKSATTPMTHDGSHERLDWKTLSLACFVGPSASAHILSLLLESTCESLHNSLLDDAKASAGALATMFRNGDNVNTQVLHSLSAPSSFDLLKALSTFGRKSRERGELNTFGTSALQLPPTKEEEQRQGQVLYDIYGIVQLLRPAWLSFPPSQLDDLITITSKALPPLTDTDKVRLAVALPFLSAALQNPLICADHPSISQEKLKALLADLAEFAISSDQHAGTRSYAAMCLMKLISCFVPESEDCPSQALVNDYVLPVLESSVERGGRAKDVKVRKRHVSDFQECLSLVAVLCAGAACRGGSSCRTADWLVVFLVDLACDASATLLINDHHSAYIDLCKFDTEASNVRSEELALDAASRFSTVLVTGGESSLWKQRLSHIAASQLHTHLEKSTGSSLPSLGAVAVACYTVCASAPEAISTKTVELTASLVGHALSSDALSTAGAGNFATVKTLVLVTILKLVSVSPSVMSKMGIHLVAGIVRSYATTGASSTTDITSKLLALQALESLARIENKSDSLAKLKPAVISILTAAMNHPSSVLRHAAVEVRNVWYLE